MKFFIVVVLTALCATAMCDIKADWAQCAQQNNVNMDVIKKVMMGEIKPADVTANMKCYFLCVSEKEGISKNGVLQPDVLIAKVSAAPNPPTKEVIMKGIDACKDKKGTDNCDTAFVIWSCMAQNKANL